MSTRINPGNFKTDDSDLNNWPILASKVYKEELLCIMKWLLYTIKDSMTIIKFFGFILVDYTVLNFPDEELLLF